jgi:hypothetical protein
MTGSQSFVGRSEENQWEDSPVEFGSVWKCQSPLRGLDSVGHGLGDVEACSSMGRVREAARVADWERKLRREDFVGGSEEGMRSVGGSTAQGNRGCQRRKTGREEV